MYVDLCYTLHISILKSLNLSANWPAAKDMIVKKLDPNYNSKMSVDEFFNIKQSSEETILDFAEQLEKMINVIEELSVIKHILISIMYVVLCYTLHVSILKSIISPRHRCATSQQ